jgi:AraC-like DNA-binding protein
VRVHTRTRLHEDAIAYVTFGPRSTGTVNGLALRPGLTLATGPGADIDFVAEAGWESLTFIVSRDDIRTHLAARGHDADTYLPNAFEFLQGVPQRTRSLFDWGRRLTETAARVPERFRPGGPELRSARGELLDNLLATLGDTRDLESGRSDRTLQSYGRVVRLAEAYAVARIGERVYVSDLCRAAAVSERTLESAFKTVMGVSPVAYLNRLRLHRARQALLSVHPRSTTVAAIALDAGFWHFGEFARAYRACFGERPSDTLRRASDAESLGANPDRTGARQRSRSETSRAGKTHEPDDGRSPRR